ncbi:MAG: CHASE2 domain-containing protein [Armatimonadota bacterium]
MSILIISLVLGLLMYFLYALNLFSFWDWKAADFFFYIRPTVDTNPDIIIVAIDDESISKFGKFPWDTKVHAKLLNNLAKQKPKLICFDILFDKPDKNPYSDQLLAEAMKNAGNVILSMGFIAQSRPADYYKRDSDITLDIARARMPLKEFRDAALDLGVTNIFPEKDAINRKIYLSIPFGDQNFLSFAAAAAMYAMNLTTKDIKILPNDIDPKIFCLGKEHINLHGDGWTIINYCYGVNRFYNIPYYEVYDNTTPKDFFKDKIILIGNTAAGLGDMWATPIWHALPGVEIQANVLNNIFDNNFLKKDIPVKNFIIIIVLSIMLGITTSLFSPVKNALCSIGMILLFLIYSFWQFTGNNVILPTATVLITIIFLFIILNIFRLVSEEREKKEITVEKEKYYEMATVDGLTQLYVARYFRQCLKEEVEKAQKENLTLSFVMVDIDNFKKVNDVYGHEQGNIVLRETAQIIKNALRSQSDIAARYGGEEIAIILPNTEPDTAFQIANRIRESMASHNYSGFKGFKQITASFGVSSYPHHAQNESELVERADEALYTSKRTGKNKVTMGRKKVEGEESARPEEEPPPQEDH